MARLGRLVERVTGWVFCRLGRHYRMPLVGGGEWCRHCKQVVD